MNDLTGMVFGDLTVMSYDTNKKSGNHHYWKCLCKCGKEKSIREHHLKKENGVKTCGSGECLGVRKNLVGMRFGKLQVVEYSHNSGSEKGKKFPYWKCLCDCGTYKVIRGHSLTTGYIKSCGCFRVEKNSTHKMSNHWLYQTWLGMMYRCYNQDGRDFKYWGGRGISVFEEWTNSPESFIDWVENNLGEKPDKSYSLDRIDNNSGYFPGNLRWATAKQQANNRRSFKQV